MRVSYLDTSAMVKLVRAEAESRALARHLRRAVMVTSALGRTELLRASLRAGGTEVLERAEGLLDRIGLLLPTMPVFDQAGRARPAALRSLDALHLVTAATLGHDLHELVTYDERLEAGAREMGLPVASPA